MLVFKGRMAVRLVHFTRDAEASMEAAGIDRREVEVALLETQRRAFVVPPPGAAPGDPTRVALCAADDVNLFSVRWVPRGKDELRLTAVVKSVGPLSETERWLYLGRN
jgi:hypothetical protein